MLPRAAAVPNKQFFKIYKIMGFYMQSEKKRPILTVFRRILIYILYIGVIQFEKISDFCVDYAVETQYIVSKIMC